MTETFIAYIDESGDEGFNFKPGVSEWFVLSAVIVRRTHDLKMVELTNGVKRKLGKPIKKALHFRKLKHEQRLLFVDRVAATNLRTVSIVVHKPSVTSPEAFNEKYRLYFYAVRFLCERVSWYARDNKLSRDEGNGEVKLVFSNRSSMPYSEMRAYLNKLERMSYEGFSDIRIHWPVIDVRQMRTYTAGKRAGLQVADAVAGSYYHAIEYSPLGFTEDRYARMLKPVVYAHRGKRLGYGLKFFPPSCERLLKTEERLDWTRREYA